MTTFIFSFVQYYQLTLLRRLTYYCVVEDLIMLRIYQYGYCYNINPYEKTLETKGFVDKIHALYSILLLLTRIHFLSECFKITGKSRGSFFIKLGICGHVNITWTLILDQLDQFPQQRQHRRMYSILCYIF